MFGLMMSEVEDDIICYVCEKVEVNPSQIIECSICNKSVHFRCKKLFGNAVSKARKKPFLCSVDCAKMQSRTAEADGTFNTLVNELRSLGQAIKDSQHEAALVRRTLEQTRLQLTALVETSKSIEDSQQFLSNQFDDLRADFSNFSKEVDIVKADNSKIRVELMKWQRKYEGLLETVDTLELQMEKVNQTSVAKNAVILGLPQMEDENTTELVYQLGFTVGYKLPPNAIASARRLYGKSEQRSSVPIVVAFHDEQTKENLIESKRRYGALVASTVSNKFKGSSRIIVRDELTVNARNLLREARNMQEELNVKYVWPGRHGKILLRKCDGAKVQEVCSKSQLLKLAANVSSEGSSGSSMAHGQP